MSEYALEALSRSRVERVYLVGRRGPLQVAFTIAELREMIRLPQTRPVFNPHDFEGLDKCVEDLPRPRKRLCSLLIKTATTPPSEEEEKCWREAKREWQLRFLRSPLEFLPQSPGGDTVGGVKLGINTLQGDVGRNQKAVATGDTEELSCGLVLRSIGYRSVSIGDDIPFDNQNGVIPNEGGRVKGQTGLYCSGWVKRGPEGVIVSTMNDAFETGKVIVDDLNASQGGDTSSHKDSLLDKLSNKGIKAVSFADWEKIDLEETQQGETAGKPREKITDIQHMLRVAHS